jgi:hypothetical protein
VPCLAAHENGRKYLPARARCSRFDCEGRFRRLESYEDFRSVEIEDSNGRECGDMPC